jgi:HK97 gp10 family phage protein
VTLKVVSNRLPALRKQLRREVSAAVRETTFAVQAGTQANIVANGQVDTGAMLNTTQSAFPSDLEGVAFNPQEYAPYQEYGTVHLPARPFMTPAAEAERPRFIGRMTRLLD